MHLLESYSLSAGQKIDKINLLEKYYPLPWDRYIVFAPFSKPSKSYDFWEEVLLLLQPILSTLDIKIVQVGAANEKPFPFCHHTQGLTSIPQVNYLIKRSLLFLGADTFSTHLAGGHDIPIVALYANNYTQNVKPYFGDKARQVLLEPPCREEGIKPTFSFDEGPNKQINQIKPEDIVRSVCKLLNVSWAAQFKSLMFGQYFNNKVVESVPDTVINIQNLGIDSLVMRMDYLFNEAVLFGQMQICPCTIISNKTINIDTLKHFKPRVKQFIYIVDENFDIQFLKGLYKLAIPTVCLSYLPEDKLNPIKLQTFDYCLIHKKEVIKPDDIPALKNKELSKIYYKSGKITLSGGKIYPSRAAWKNNQPISSFQVPTSPVIDSPDFWTDFDYHYLLEKLD